MSAWKLESDMFINCSAGKIIYLIFCLSVEAANASLKIIGKKNPSDFMNLSTNYSLCGKFILALNTLLYGGYGLLNPQILTK